MANALHSNKKAKHPSGYIQCSEMRIYEPHDDLDQLALPRNKLPAVIKFSEQSHHKLEPCRVFSLYLK